MSRWLVIMRYSSSTGMEDEHFLCDADNEAHAVEQAENAYPEASVYATFKLASESA